MSFTRTAFTTAPVAVVGSLALSLGVADAASAADTHELQPGETITGIAIKNGLQTRDILRWNDLSFADARTLAPGNVLKLSGSDGASTPDLRIGRFTSATETHTVEAGDTLWSIAQEHGISLDKLLKANDLKASSIIYPGQELKLSTLPTEPVDENNSYEVLQDANDDTSSDDTDAKTHTVEPGDTLGSIADEYGLTVADLLEANGLEPGAIIYPGQELKLEVPKPETVDNPQRFAALDGAQTENGALIIRVGRSIGASDRAIAEALATAMVESSLRNVDHGDRDSLGLFQQRKSTGWGTKAQIMDRERSTKAFFGGVNDPNGSASRGLYDLSGWEDQPFGVPSQRVQVSAHPDRYAQWKTQAYRWLAELS